MNIKYLIYESLNNRHGRSARLLAVHCSNQQYDLYNLNRIHKKDLKTIIELNDKIFELEKKIVTLENALDFIKCVYQDYKSPLEFQKAINRHAEEQRILNDIISEVAGACSNE